MNLVNECRNGGAAGCRRVTILGAGIAGLVAAYELERLGHSVRILEGSARVGGRVWTHRFGTGERAPHGELGAMRIPSRHTHVLHYVHKLGLAGQLTKFTTIFEDKNAFVSIGGRVLRVADALESIVQINRDKYAARGASERTLLFAGWLQLLVDAVSPGQLRLRLERDLVSHLLVDLARLDLEPFVDVERRDVSLHKFVTAYPAFRFRLDESLALFFDDVLTETSSDLYRIRGGTDGLIEQLRRSLRCGIEVNREVVALRVRERGVEVSWRDAEALHTEECEYVLSTLPFSIMRNLTLEGVDDDKRDIIAKTSYCSATKVLFHCARPFWQDAGIRGGGSFTDDCARQVYYPSSSLYPPNGSLFPPSPSPRSTESVLLASYTIGNDAERLQRMSESARIEAVRLALCKFHPELDRPDVLLGATSIAWGSYKWTQGACAVGWGVGEPTESERRFAGNQQLIVARERAARPQKRLFFAGEHCSEKMAWMEGSVESALRAVHALSRHLDSADPQGIGLA